MSTYSLEPVEVPLVDTTYRSIKTTLPVPESVHIFEALARAEPRSMMGQPPIVWNAADDCTVSDKWGNRWLDWSSCVLVTNAGHAPQAITQALHAKIDQGLLASYVFVHEDRIKLIQGLQQLAPVPENYHVFLLTTGSEATENCIKLSKTYAREKHGPNKKYIVTFDNAFHGRTMGAQLAGGIDGLKTWMGQTDRTFVQVPFPDGFRNTDTRFDLFVTSLKEQGISPQEIAGVMSESYQGGGPFFMPKAYAQTLAAFCDEHDIVLTMDEVQAGFGRTGAMFCYEHYDIQPDLIACGKGISSSLPLSAVIGRADIMALYAPGSMTSTHSGSPLCVAAALANLDLFRTQGYVANAARLEPILMDGLHAVQARYRSVLGCVLGKGLVAGIQVVKPGTKTPDSEVATAINLACFQRGLLMFAPVGTGGGCIKIAPPLSTSEEALREGLAVFKEAVDAVLAV